MGRLDTSYCSVAEYRQRVKSKGTGEASDLAAELLHVSRLADAEFGLVPGGLLLEEDVARLFDGTGDEYLELVDGRGRRVPFAEINAEGIAVDTNRDGAWATTFDLGDGWVVGEPANAPDDGEPYTALRLITRSNAAASVGEILSRWPRGVQNVRITGTLGYPELPGLATEYVALVTRDLRDAHIAGGVLAVSAADDSLPLSSESWRIKAQIRRVLSRRPPVAIG